jgi:hypothetical protein
LNTRPAAILRIEIRRADRVERSWAQASMTACMLRSGICMLYPASARASAGQFCLDEAMC